MKNVILFVLVLFGSTVSNAQINCTLKASIDTVQKVRCYRGSDGAIMIKVVNGKPPINYKWSIEFPNNNPVFHGVSAGLYSVTVTDSTGCRDSILNIKVHQDTPVIKVETTPATNGLDGKAKVTITKGIYTFSRNFINLRIGNHYLTVTDSDACGYIVEAQITSLTATNDLNTEGGNKFEIVKNSAKNASVFIHFNELKAFDLTIFTLNGQQVFNQKFKEKKPIVPIEYQRFTTRFVAFCFNSEW